MLSLSTFRMKQFPTWIPQESLRRIWHHRPRTTFRIAITPHPTREFDKGSELTPSNDVGPIVDEGCVGPVRSNKLLLVFLVLSRPLLRVTRGEVEEGAPAATPDSIMFLDHPLKVGPCRGPELAD